MSSKTLVLITGANQGLGYYAAQQLAATGNHHVLIGSRDINKANKAIETLAAD
jgi:NAD(P)-dependent dehydrogenase (short-subunit alcohol dehydrogenase family)